jgi:hypothetical protein
VPTSAALTTLKRSRFSGAADFVPRMNIASVIWYGLGTRLITQRYAFFAA